MLWYNALKMLLQMWKRIGLGKLGSIELPEKVLSDKINLSKKNKFGYGKSIIFRYFSPQIRFITFEAYSL